MVENAEEPVVSNQLSEESTGFEQMQAENEKYAGADNLISSHQMNVVRVTTQDWPNAPAGFYSEKEINQAVRLNLDGTLVGNKKLSEENLSEKNLSDKGNLSEENLGKKNVSDKELSEENLREENLILSDDSSGNCELNLGVPYLEKILTNSETNKDVNKTWKWTMAWPR